MRLNACQYCYKHEELRFFRLFDEKITFFLYSAATGYYYYLQRKADFPQKLFIPGGMLLLTAGLIGDIVCSVTYGWTWARAAAGTLLLLIFVLYVAPAEDLLTQQVEEKGAITDTPEVKGVFA